MPWKDKEKQNAYHRAWRKANPQKGIQDQARYRAKHPEKFILKSARTKARERGLDFNLEESDIIIPDVCPVFGSPLVMGSYTGDKSISSPNSPSLDRIDSSKGYVKGNVWVISWRANHIKTDATLEELELLVVALRKLQEKP